MIGVTEGFIFFGILDVCTVPVLAVAVLVLSLRFDLRALNLYFTQYGRVPQGEFQEKVVLEKEGEAAPAVTAGGGVVAPEQVV